MRGERVEPCLVAVVHASHHGEAAVLAAAHQRHHLHRLRLRLTSLARALSKLESVPARSPVAGCGDGSAPPLSLGSTTLCGWPAAVTRPGNERERGVAAGRRGAVVLLCAECSAGAREACADDPSCVLLNGLEVTVLGRVCFVRILLFPIT